MSAKRTDEGLFGWFSAQNSRLSGNAERFPPSGREVDFLPKAKKTEGARRPVIEFEETYDEWDEEKTSSTY